VSNPGVCLVGFVIAFLAISDAADSRQPYVEMFDHGPGGWYADRYYTLPVWDGVAYCLSP